MSCTMQVLLLLNFNIYHFMIRNHQYFSRLKGAILVDNLEIPNINVILNTTLSGEAIAVLAEFKLSINAYLEELVVSNVRSLSDIIAFNQNFSDLVSICVV